MVGFDTIFLYKQQDGIWADKVGNFHNRGFLFGDGLFETMVFSFGKIRFGAEHMDRLCEGLKIMSMEREGLSKISEIEALLKEIFGDKGSFRVRWNVYRSGLGKYTPEEGHVLESLHVQTLVSPPRQKENSYFSQSVFIMKTPWSHCKTLSALPYVMANQERKLKGFDEVILTTPDGFVCEAGSSNLFWIKNDRFFTPSLETGCIAGIGRRVILSYLRKNNIPYSEGFFERDELLAANKIITSNATGISYLKTIENKSLDTNRSEGLDAIFELK